MIQIAERLMENFRNVKSHLQLLVNPLLAKNKSLGIQAVRNIAGAMISVELNHHSPSPGLARLMAAAMRHMRHPCGIHWPVRLGITRDKLEISGS